MPIQIEIVTEDPIILVTVYGEFTAEDARDISLNTASVLHEYGRKIYRIHDIRAADMSFPNILAVIREARKGEFVGSLDERVQMLVVGRNPMFDLARSSYENSGRSVPVFDCVHDAIEAINLGMLRKTQ